MSSFPISISWQAGTPPTQSFDAMAKAATSLDSSLSASSQKFSQFGSTIGQLESPLSSVGNSMGTLSSNMDGLDSSLSGSGAAMGELAGSTTDLNGAISETGGFVTDASGSMSELSGVTGETGGAMTELGGSTQELNSVIGETGGLVSETGTSITDMGTAATDGGTAMTELNTATTDTNTALTESVDALGNVVPGLQDTATGAADSAQGFSDLAPPIEDTSTALDSTSGLLEGVSPLLESTGTNAATAATSSEDLSGALGGMNTELPGVTGGLTSANTLTGDLGTSADTSAKSTDTLKGSLSTLAFGLTSVIGAGYGVVNSFLGIRDANIRLETAQLKVEKSTSAVESGLLSLGKSIRKLATDSDAPIRGINALNTAFGVFEGLIKAGVTSGPEYTTALNNLKIAADGLHGSTQKDNDSITALQINIDKFSQKVTRANVDTQKHQKALENVSKATLDFGMSLATLVGGMGAMVQTLTSGRAAAATLGTTLSTTVLPALAAIALPVGIAIAAMAAFVAVVELIRSNIKVFDDLGVKIGEVFPEMKGFLDTSRQAFINFSDGMNTAISIMLGGLDSLTGGTTAFQKEWDAFTGTLPKGTGELGLAGTTSNLVGISFTKMSDRVNIGAGKWRVAEGNLFHMNGTLTEVDDTLKATAGNWDQYGDGTAFYSKNIAVAAEATKGVVDPLNQATEASDAMGASIGATGVILREQSANYSELTNAQKLSKISLNEVIKGLSDEKLERYNAIEAANNYLEAHGTTAEAVGLSGDMLIGYVDGLKEEPDAYSKSVQEATKYITTKHKEVDITALSEAEVIKKAEALKEEDKALGKVTDTTAKHIDELNKLVTTLNEGTAELAFYSDATQVANRMQLEFNNGVANAGLKLIDQQAALANNTGELKGNVALLEQGKIQEVEYGEGVLAAGKALETKTRALAESVGKFNETNRLMSESDVLLVDLTQGYVEGEQAVLDHSEALAKDLGNLISWNSEATKTRAVANEIVQGYQDAIRALQDLTVETNNSIGAIASLRQELEDMDGAQVRFNQGLVAGKLAALEWIVGLDRARGEAMGFRDEIVDFAQKVPGAMWNMSNLSTEAIQQFVEVVKGIPSAFEGILDDLDSFGQKMVSVLSKAGEEGKIDIEENMEDLEDKLNLQFTDPLKEKLKLETNRAAVQEDIDLLMGGLAMSLQNNPLKIEADTMPAQGAIDALIQFIDMKAAEGVTGFEPLRTALVNLSSVDMTNIKEFAPALAQVVLQAKAAGQPFEGLLASFSQMGPLASMTADELAAVGAAYKTMGLNLNTTTGQITDDTGTIVGNFNDMNTQSQDPLIQLATSIGGIGDAGGTARLIMAQELVALSKVIEGFTSGTATRMGQITTSFGSMANNTGTHMLKVAREIVALSNVIQGLASGTPARTSAVASAFSSMASSITSSASKATAAVKALQSAINSLQSKTITLTTVHVQRYVTQYAAHGGAFVASSPTNVGPLKVSEFGQKELVTVTPLEGPGRNAIKGVSSAINDEVAKKGRRKMDEQDERKAESKPTTPTILHDTINLTIDGQKLLSFVNRRLLENTDALT